MKNKLVAVVLAIMALNVVFVGCGKPVPPAVATSTTGKPVGSATVINPVAQDGMQTTGTATASGVIPKDDNQSKQADETAAQGTQVTPDAGAGSADKKSPGGTATTPRNSGAGGGQPDRSAMNKFREDHKNAFLLQTQVSNIERLEKDGDAKLSSAQAMSILDILNPTRSVEDIDDATANEMSQQIGQQLTDDQKTEMAAFSQRGGRGGAPNSNGGQRGANGGNNPRGTGSGQNTPVMTPNPGMGGGMRAPMDMNHFNPFYQPKDAAVDDRRAHRWDNFFSGLENKANGN